MAALLCLALRAGPLPAQGPVQPDAPPAGSPVSAPATRFLPRTAARDLIAAAPGSQPAAAPAAPGALPPPAVVPPPPGTTPPILNMPLTPTPFFTPGANRYIQQLPGPDNILEVCAGRIQIFNLLQTPARLQIADESVASYALLSPCELSLQGLRVGSTVLNIWFFDVIEKKNKLVSFLVRVLPDPDARNRLERAYKNLENEVNRSFPNSRVILNLVGDKLIVMGQARDFPEANMIMRVIQSNVLPEAADSPDFGRPPATDPASNNYYQNRPAFARQVVNMMRVIGEQQVLLQVQIVEVDRAAARSVGINFAVFGNHGGFFVGGTTGNLAFQGTGFATFGQGTLNTSLTGLGGPANLPIALDHGQIQLAIAALRSLSYARYLAEPNLVAINGQTAAFQVGSLLPVPVLGGIGGGAGLGGGLGGGFGVGTNFIPTGVQLLFTPYITDRDRIRLVLNTEVSDRDLSTAPTIIGGAAIPSLVTRNFQTTVELREGETIAVAGLIENKLNATANRLPFLGSVPILNRIGAYDTIGNYEKELVVLVTPRLVRPLKCKDMPPPPGVDLLEPTDWEFYLLGRIESHTGLDYRSPIHTDCSRNFQRFRVMEMMWLFGPSGPSMDLPPVPPDGPPGPPGGGPGLPPPGTDVPPGPLPPDVLPPAPMPAGKPGRPMMPDPVLAPPPLGKPVK